LNVGLSINLQEGQNYIFAFDFHALFFQLDPKVTISRYLSSCIPHNLSFIIAKHI